jgi:hypothetical protein
MLRGLVVLLVLANVAFFSWSRGWLAPVWPAPRAGEREPERLAQQVRPQAVVVLTVAEAGVAAAAVSSAAAAEAAASAGLPAPASAAASTSASASASTPALASSAAAATPSDAAAAAALLAANAATNPANPSNGGVCLQAGPFTPTEATAAAAALQQVGLPAGSWARVEGPPPTPQWLVYAGRFADAAARRARQQEWARANLTAQLLDAPADLAPGLTLGRYASRDAADAALAALAPAVRQVTRVVQLPPSPATAWLRAASADKALAARLTGLPAPWLGSFKACVR